MGDVATGSGAAAEAFHKLGVNVLDVEGKQRSMQDIFPELISSLQSVEDVTERNTLAYDVFGGKSKEIAAFLGMSAEEMAEVQERAHEMGLVMSGESLNSANEFKISVENLKAQFGAMSNEIGVSVIPIFQDFLIPVIETTVIPAIKLLADTLGTVVNIFSRLPTPVQACAVGLGLLVAGMGPAILITGKLIVAFKGLTLSTGALTVGFNVLKAAMVSHPIMILATVATSAVAGVVALTRAFNKKKKAVEDTAKPTETLVDNVNELTDATRKSEYQLKQEADAAEKATQARKKAAQEADTATKKRLQDLDELVNKHEKAYEEMFIAEEDKDRYQLASEEAQALARAQALGASEAQLEIIREYYAEREIRLDKEIADEKVKRQKEEADKEAAEMEKLTKELDKQIADRQKIENEWINKRIDQFAEGYTALHIQLQREYDLAIEEADKLGADTTEIHAYYADEISKLHAQQAREVADSWKKEMSTLGSFMAGAVNKIGSLFAQSSRNEEMRLDEEYKTRKAFIEANVLDEEERNAQLMALDEEVDAQKLALQKEQASRDKALGIFNTVIDTAAAIVKALTAGPIAGPIMAGIIGALGVAQTAVIAATPEPFYAGGLIKGSSQGIVAQVGERNQDEVILPLEKGTEQIAQKLNNSNGGGYTVHYHISNIYGGDKGLKELEKRLEPIRLQEARRTGRAV